jgi:hypothetical protein
MCKKDMDQMKIHTLRQKDRFTVKLIDAWCQDNQINIVGFTFASDITATYN